MAQFETAWLADLVYTKDGFLPDLAVVSDSHGRVRSLVPSDQLTIDPVRLRGRAIVPGLVNAHSHAFQRVIRGRTEYRSSHQDSFWTWREMMYHAAMRLNPDDLYDASRMAFLEMALSGVTTVGEFHYLHHGPDGTRYEDVNLLAKQVIRAARDVGLRIALLRVAYARSGFRTEPNPRQVRFIESSSEEFLAHFQELTDGYSADSSVLFGLAPHSIRAVPADYLKDLVDFARTNQLPVHMHVAEQPAEIEASIEEYGKTPIALLDELGLLNSRFTGVHAVHVTADEAALLAKARANVCACPTTERNLGDGIIPADLFFKEGVKVCFGSDSHTQIDLLEDARELEYHLRLQKLERAVLAEPGGSLSSLAGRLFDGLTANGADSLGYSGGRLNRGEPADFFTVDLNDPSIAGAGREDLLPAILFSASRAAIRDVIVGAERIVSDGRHPHQNEITERFAALQKKLWN